MVRIDMSEYMEKFSVQRLIGAPPGYVGYDEGGQLTEAVRRRPYCVILLDEIEKAHPDVFNILLQVLDDGRLTDGQGRVVSFKNAIVIMTSNVGSQFIREFNAKAGTNEAVSAMTDFAKQAGKAAGLDTSVLDKLGAGGQGKDDYTVSVNELDDDKKLARAIDNVLRTTFRPEFLNRIDDIIIFHSLRMENIDAIVTLQLQSVRERLAERHIKVTVTPSAVEQLSIDGFDPVYGARPLKRLIQHEIVDLLANGIVAGTLGEGDSVVVDLDDRNDYTLRKN
jgi:ATP-dependent Clp protease ATP-binding subunit ClpB